MKHPDEVYQMIENGTTDDFIEIVSPDFVVALIKDWQQFRESLDSVEAMSFAETYPHTIPNMRKLAHRALEQSDKEWSK